MKQIVTLFLLVLISLNTIAQNNPEDELGTWYILSTTNKVSDKLNINLQSQVRTYELASELEQFKVRLNMPYQVADNFSLALGYAYFRNDQSYLSNIPERFDEHRLVFDMNLKSALGAMQVGHRFRAEQRFFGNDNDNSLWLRYMVKLAFPITEHLTADFYDEVFLNVESPVFAQNWIGFGLGYKISDRFSTRMGYQKISQEPRSFDRLLVSFNITTDFRKREK